MHTRMDTTHTYMKMGAGEGQRLKKLKEKNIMGQEVKTDLPLPTLYWVSCFLSPGSLWLCPASLNGKCRPIGNWLSQ